MNDKSKRKRFKTELLSGHKGGAFEVPFDPGQEWHLSPRQLWHGRRGYPVAATIKGVSFESAIVPRQRKFYLLIDDETSRVAKVSENELVAIALQPLFG